MELSCPISLSYCRQQYFARLFVLFTAKARVFHRAEDVPSMGSRLLFYDKKSIFHDEFYRKRKVLTKHITEYFGNDKRTMRKNR